jgi:hypothetical protein
VAERNGPIQEGGVHILLIGATEWIACALSTCEWPMGEGSAQFSVQRERDEYTTLVFVIICKKYERNEGCFHRERESATKG